MFQRNENESLESTKINLVTLEFLINVVVLINLDKESYNHVFLCTATLKSLIKWEGHNKKEKAGKSSKIDE